MIRNRRLARAIADAAMAGFLAKLEYKCAWYGAEHVKADRWFASSRLCAHCGWKNEELTLSDREWWCGGCGALNERDHNAAVNLSIWPGLSFPVSGRQKSDDALISRLYQQIGQLKVERDPALSTLRQCALMGISRSSVYYRPRAPSQKDLALMKQIDQQYLATPFYGSRRMKVWLDRQGHRVNRRLHKSGYAMEEGIAGRSGRREAGQAAERPYLPAEPLEQGPVHRREMVDREHPALSTLRQCALMGISRSSVYYRPREGPGTHEADRPAGYCHIPAVRD